MDKKVLRIIGVALIPIMYIVFFLATKYISLINFSYDLLFFATMGFIYISLHFFLDIKKMYNTIFKYRYLIGVTIFIIFVIGGYHGSSINMWDRYINPEVKVEDTAPILGIARGIRSDEWMVSTPYNLSQTLENVSLSDTNNLINAKESNVALYPRLIVKDIGMLLHPEQFGYLFLPKENAFSFNWYFCYFAAFFVTLELFMIITKKNKLFSVLGAFLLVLSSSNLWWGCCTYILYGGAALLLIYKFINTKNIAMRLILSILLGWIAGCYISTMYPAWIIPYAYLFALMFIWMLIENKDKVVWSDSAYLVLTIITFGIIFIPLYLKATNVFEIVSNTVYPGERNWLGGEGGYRLLFNYLLAIFFPFTKEISNPCELSQHLSFFPIPIIMGVYYIIKNKKENKKKDWFLILLCSYAIFLTIMCIVPLPEFISKLTLLYMSTSFRAQLVIGYTSIFIMIYILSRYSAKEKAKEFNKEKQKVLIAAILTTVLGLYISYNYIKSIFPLGVNIVMCVISFIIFVPVFYLIMRNEKRTTLILFILILGINTISIFLVQPLDKGLEILYKKPFALEIQKIVKEEPDAKFLVTNEFITIQNYILVNGGKSINSTNFVPNLDLWNKLDPEKKYNRVYNRYSHIGVLLVDEKTSFELISDDRIQLNLNYNDICLTDANYLVSTYELEEKEEYYTNVYNEHDIYIYKTTCSN